MIIKIDVDQQRCAESQITYITEPQEKPIDVDQKRCADSQITYKQNLMKNRIGKIVIAYNLF